MFIRRENFKQFIKFYPVVSFIIAINLIIYILTIPSEMRELLFTYGMSVNLLISNGEWWRVVTSTFLHADFFHVLFNMFSLFLFGS
ncbi:Rhomboid protease GluP OS=Ureibacillus acetophenoni OX=614649 GN=SAMN05877842_111142 PE=3 SV=1 [Ureibacillus acetophenoni]